MNLPTPYHRVNTRGCIRYFEAGEPVSMLVRAVFPRGIGCDALDTAGLPLLFGAVAVRDARSDRSPNMHVNHSDPTMVHNQEYEVKLKAMDAGTTVRRWCLGD